VAVDAGLKCVCRENYKIDSVVAGKLKCVACPAGQVRYFCCILPRFHFHRLRLVSFCAVVSLSC